MGNRSCIPWSLPVSDGSGIGMCDPWDAVDFRKSFVEQGMVDNCPECLYVKLNEEE